MIVQDLIILLKRQNPNAEVLIRDWNKWPYTDDGGHYNLEDVGTQDAEEVGVEEDYVYIGIDNTAYPPHDTEKAKKPGKGFVGVVCSSQYRFKQWIKDHATPGVQYLPILRYYDIVAVEFTDVIVGYDSDKVEVPLVELAKSQIIKKKETKGQKPLVGVLTPFIERFKVWLEDHKEEGKEYRMISRTTDLRGVLFDEVLFGYGAESMTSEIKREALNRIK